MLTPTSKESMSRKRKRETEEGSPSAEAVLDANLKETPPMVSTRWKTAAYRDNSTSRKLAEVMADLESASDPVTEEDFKPQRKKIKRRSTSGQTWEVDVGKHWVSSQPERWTTNREQSPSENSREEHSLFLVDSSTHDKGTRELSKETGLGSVQKAPEMGHTTRSRSEKAGSEEPVRMNLGENTARVL